MATTTNYGWVTPDDTALVKDGAAAIRTLGTSADTTVYNNDLAAIKKTFMAAKGDLISASANDTPLLLSVGANGTTLVANSATATGLEWATPSSGGMTSLATGSLTGASVTISTINQTFNNLQLVIEDFFPATSGQSVTLRFNADTNNNYVQIKGRSNTATMFVGTDSAFFFEDNITASSNSSTGTVAVINIYNYAETTTRCVFDATAFYTSSTPTNILLSINGLYNVADNIDSITISCSSGNFGGGSFTLFGVK